MDSSTQNEYSQKLEEFIYDEDKIVTCTWLSTTLGINIIEAKKLLDKYVKDVRHIKPNDLSVTYVIVGLKEGSIKIMLVTEKELTDKLSLYEKVTSQHIYSVQKLKDMDLNVLNLVDAFDSQVNLLLSGSITSKNCIKRILKPKQIVSTEKPLSKNAKLSFFGKSQSDGAVVQVKSESTSNKEKLASEKSTPSNVHKQKQNGLTGFLSKSQSEGTIKTKNTAIKHNGKTKRNEIMGKFFSKAAIKSEHKKNEVEEISGDKNVLEDIKIETNIKMQSDVKVETDCKAGSQKTKRSRTDNKSKQPQKRRKRIVETNNSDSDDIFSSDDDEDWDLKDEKKKRPLADMESGEDEFSPIYQSPSKPTNKKRQQVTRTFIDEDEYVITRKEWIVESGSESEKEQKLPNKTVSNVGGEVEVIGESEFKNNSEKKIQAKTSEVKKVVEEVVTSKATAKKGKGNNKEKNRNQQTLFNFFKKS